MTIAGSWIGGGANQTAVKEVFGVSDSLFSAMITIDVFVGYSWMAFLLYGADISDRIDQWFGVDTSAIEHLRNKVADYQASIARITNLTDVVTVMAVGFGVTAFAHFGADIIAPWIADNASFLADTASHRSSSGLS